MAQKPEELKVFIGFSNYFGTPVGPEYKKKFARNVGIAVLILFAFYGIWSLVSDVNKPEPQSILPDPICFAETVTAGDTGSAVTMEYCNSIETFEELGCTKPMLEHLYRYSNLLEREFDGKFFMDAIGLPETVSQEGLDKCTDSLLEKRTGNKPTANTAIEPEIGKFGSYQLQDNSESFEIKYHIQGGVLEDIRRDSNSESLNVMIDGMYDGFLEITIPRTLIDAKIGQSDDDFFVLIDRNQVPFEETKNESERKLSINFERGAQLIEMIGNNPEF